MKNAPTISESTDEDKNPPRDLLNIIEPINYDLNYSGKRGELVPYLMNERDDDWRCYLVDADGNTLAAALVWSKLDRHNVSMMLYGFEEQAKVNVIRGLKMAAERMHLHNQQVLGLK